jgi:hypothetical protein
MQSKTRRVHVFRAIGGVQSDQQPGEFRGMLCIDASGRAGDEESFQTLVAEASDHAASTVT